MVVYNLVHSVHISVDYEEIDDYVVFNPSVVVDHEMDFISVVQNVIGLGIVY